MGRCIYEPVKKQDLEVAAINEIKFAYMGLNGEMHEVTKEEFDRFITRLDGIVTKIMIGCVVVLVFMAAGGNTFAAAAAGNKVMEGLAPLVKIISDFSQPICYGYMVKSGLKLAGGKEEEAKKIFSNSAISYVGIKFIPQVFKFLDTLNLFS